jgi:hypothetical protein
MCGFPKGPSMKAVEPPKEKGSIGSRLVRLFLSGWRGTAEDAAYMIGASVPGTRPRISELRNRGLIRPVGEKIKTSYGKLAHTWEWATERGVKSPGS